MVVWVAEVGVRRQSLLQAPQFLLPPNKSTCICQLPIQETRRTAGEAGYQRKRTKLIQSQNDEMVQPLRGPGLNTRLSSQYMKSTLNRFSELRLLLFTFACKGRGGGVKQRNPEVDTHPPPDPPQRLLPFLSFQPCLTLDKTLFFCFQLIKQA